MDMQMKMFLHREPEAAEKTLNDWLERTPVKIYHVVQSQSENQGKFMLIVSVFYENVKQVNSSFKMGELKKAHY